MAVTMEAAPVRVLVRVLRRSPEVDGRPGQILDVVDDDQVRRWAERGLVLILAEQPPLFP